MSHEHLDGHESLKCPLGKYCEEPGTLKDSEKRIQIQLEYASVTIGVGFKVVVIELEL